MVFQAALYVMTLNNNYQKKKHLRLSDVLEKVQCLLFLSIIHQQAHKRCKMQVKTVWSKVFIYMSLAIYIISEMTNPGISGTHQLSPHCSSCRCIMLEKSLVTVRMFIYIVVLDILACLVHKRNVVLFSKLTSFQEESGNGEIILFLTYNALGRRW